LQVGGLSYLEPPDYDRLTEEFRTFLPKWLAIGCAATVVLGVLLRRDFRRPAQGFAIPFLLIWGPGFFIALVIKSWVSEPIFNTRNALVVSPALLILIAHLMCRWTSAAVAQVAAAATAAVVAIVFVWPYGYYRRETKEDFRGTAALASEWMAQDPKTVLVLGSRYYDYYLDDQYDARVVAIVDRDLDGLVATARKLGRERESVLVLTGHLTLSEQQISMLEDEAYLVRVESSRRSQAIWLRQRARASIGGSRP
jgi:hypothetical protein